MYTSIEFDNEIKNESMFVQIHCLIALEYSNRQELGMLKFKMIIVR